MKKISIPFTGLLFLALTLSGCSTVNAVKQTMANAQNQKRQLADGSTLNIDFNLQPTADWYCTQQGTQQSFDWGMIQNKGQFTMEGSFNMLLDQIANYASQNHLKANYANLITPGGIDISHSTGNFTATSSSDSIIYADYYSCKYINPDHKVTRMSRKTNVDFSTGSTPSNSGFLAGPPSF